MLRVGGNWGRAAVANVVTAGDGSSMESSLTDIFTVATRDRNKGFTVPCPALRDDVQVELLLKNDGRT